jgi:O-antigen/teichoic acid export membrane protein
MTLIGNAIGQVFFQRASEAQNANGNLADVVTPLYRRLVAFGLFPMLLLALLGRDVFMVILGPRWSEAGVYAQILSLWMFFAFVSSPLSTLFSVLERQEGALLLNGLILATRLIALGTGSVLGNARLALILFAMTGILVYGGLCVWILSACGVSRSQALGILLRYVGISLLIIAPLAGTKALLSTAPLILLVGGAIACGVYGLVLMHEEPDVVAQLRRLVTAR